MRWTGRLSLRRTTSRPARVAVAGLLVGAAVLAPSPASALTAPRTPAAVHAVRAVPGPLPDQVTVSWRGGDRSSRVAVVAGANATTDVRAFHSAWFPAPTRSITLTVPKRLRHLMGGGTGNPVWVKVVQSSTASRAFAPRSAADRGYRVSPAGVRSQARSAAVDEAVDRLVVGELNVQSAAATSGFGADDRWAARVGRIAAAIGSSTRSTTGVGRPGVLLTAELTTTVQGACENHPGRGEPYRCRTRTQLADLAGRLQGLRLADEDAYDRVMDRGRRSSTWAHRVTAGAHVFYDPERFVLVDHGFFSPAMAPDEGFADVQGLGVPGWTPSTIGPDRWLSWAELEVRSSGRRFLAVAVHLPAGASPALRAVRSRTAERLAAAVDRRAGGLPVVLGGDMNGDPTNDPTAAQAVLVRHGFFDAAATPDSALRRGAAFNTANLSGPQPVDPGYGARPVRHRYDTSRIDFILLKGSPHAYRYANVLRLHPDGSFVRRLQGSDHNLQLADVGIAGPTR